MTDPAKMLEWLDRRISSAMTWLADHGRRSKKPRSLNLIEIKEEDVAMLEEIRGAYRKALKKRKEAA